MALSMLHGFTLARSHTPRALASRTTKGVCRSVQATAVARAHVRGGLVVQSSALRSSTRKTDWRLSAKGFGSSAETEEASATKPMAAEGDEGIAFEPTKKKGPTVVNKDVEKVTGDLTEAQKTETLFVGSLVVVFSIVMLMGSFIAVSGFLSDDLDQLAQTTVYPAFTPVVGVFLALSSAYGLWKASKGEM
eukprot:CAMPEP_0118931750 /NCGR_PEP_ID=MMETSP1169-20130426/7981_1 /TAXON_ID=36882 /ORGANISM="Pyramimonas obovata, Strain CCMP722" /LENGTH=190 /DNA_ID=CAMNT_0006874285 /DNA_START=57 /DNA_END=629 /DNA_ORIENTATION=+